PHLDVHGAGLRSLAAFHQPRRAVAAGAPQTAALPAGVRIVDAPVQALGVEAHGIWDAQRDHLSVLERNEAVVQVRGRDRNVLPQARRVVVIDPTVVARLGAGVLEAVEARARIPVVREAFGAVIAGRLRAVERGLAPATVEADERAVRARPPQDAVLVDVAPAHADAFLRNRVELRQLRLRVEAQEAGATDEHVDGVPDRAVGRMRHHGVGTGTRDARVLARLGRLVRLGPLVELAVAVRVQHERRPTLRLGRVARLVPHLRVDPPRDLSAAREP